MENLWFELLGSASSPLAAGDITVDTSLAAIELAVSGQCSALLPSRFVARHLAAGRLQTTAGATVAMTEAHYLVRPSSRGNLSPEATLFADWLRSLDS
jgi:DNA-binding transcriptional LysR family regulator